MSLLTAAELVKLRRQAEQKANETNSEIRWTKAQINAVFDELDDWLEGERNQISAAINSASGSVNYTVAEKKWLFAFYMGIKLIKELT